jgi:hypothetical protein
MSVRLKTNKKPLKKIEKKLKKIRINFKSLFIKQLQQLIFERFFQFNHF